MFALFVVAFNRGERLAIRTMDGLEMLTLRQKYPASPPLDIAAEVRAQLVPLRKRVRPGQQVAVGVGSRGISNLQAIVRAVIAELRGLGAEPFIVPAMGSHGGATPDGQTTLLADYGVSEQTMQTPVRAQMEAEQVGATEEGFPVFVSAEALRADGVIVINRVKPHTDFSATIGSGLLKMLVVGLGKRSGAANFHVASSRLGYERALRTSARVILNSGLKVLGGVAIVEDQKHATAAVKWLEPLEMETGEEELFKRAKALMPALPFEDVDLLIVDRIGKNISGAGLDPNITGRGVHGYSSSLADCSRKPMVRRLFVRDLTPESHGNAIGIGMADFTTTRLARAMDQRVTAINAITALTVQGAKVPIHFESDREVVEQALISLGLGDATRAKVIRIADTLSLDRVEVSAAYENELTGRSDLERVGDSRPMAFDEAGNLMSMG